VAEIWGIYETVLYGDDLEALTAFYADVLGLRVVDGPDELAAAIRLPDSGVLLLFAPGPASRPGRPVPSHGTSGEGHVAFRVPARSLDEWRVMLTARGVAIEREVEWPAGGRSIYVRDPAGNSVELAAGELWPA